MVMTPLKMFWALPGNTIANGSGATAASRKNIPRVAVTTLGRGENRTRDLELVCVRTNH